MIPIRSIYRSPVAVSFCLLAAVLVVTGGCTRTQYRTDADIDAYATIAERNSDPRWHTSNYKIDIDPRSRFYDPNDPDRTPMPVDDPASNQYLQNLHGTTGWKHWQDNGQLTELENPAWRKALSEYVEMTSDGSVKLNVNSGLQLAYVHSPSHQSQLETLYLSALEVTAERFQLDTQFFGGYDASYSHFGSLNPASLFGPAFVGSESNRVTMGRPSAGNPVLQARRRLATAGEILAGFANSFVFEFTGGDANLSASLANFALVQPLLRGAGKDIALESLTSAERSLLANLRAYSQYRQGFYTQVTIGELGVVGPQQGGRGTNLTVFGGQGSVGGYIGLLQQMQRIRNNEDNLSLQLRTLAQLEALLAVGVIDLVQVDQFRQSVEFERASLLQNQNSFELSLDRFKTNTLGLPPDMLIELDDGLVQQFQLVAREATEVLDAIGLMQDQIGELTEDSGAEATRLILDEVFVIVKAFQQQLDHVAADILRMEEAVPIRQRSMTADEKVQFKNDRDQLNITLSDLKHKFSGILVRMEEIHQGLSEETQPAKTRQLVVWLGDLLRLVHRSILVQARARLEAVTIDTVDLKPADAFNIALNNRLDFMNGRAALVDRWRQIQIKADALQSILNVTARGDVRTAGDNPVDFQLPTGSFQLGLEFDAPLTRLLERNDYRRSLIAYQQSRRGLIQSRDKLHLGLRALLRQIEQLRTTLEIQRRAVAIAIRRVDLNRANLYAPVPPPRPGQRAAQFGPTAAVNMLSALSSLRDTQNQFLGVWLNYYAARMRLSRELGMMPLDEKGRWLNQSLPTSNSEAQINQPISLAESLPPGIPSEWQQIADRINSNRPSPAPNRPVYRRNRALQPRPHMTDIGNASNQYRRSASGPSIPRR